MAEIRIALMTVNAVEKSGDVDELAASVHEVDIQNVVLGWHALKIDEEHQIPNTKFRLSGVGAKFSFQIRFSQLGIRPCKTVKNVIWDPSRWTA